MKFIHFSDTHLGFSDLSRIDPETGMNQREVDFYRAWERVIEAILDLKPDFVVHAGDLFQTPRPNNRALCIAAEGIQKVTNAGIPFVVVAGNHSTPRIRQTGSIFETIALFHNVYAAYRSRYERFRIGECAVHCIPHCSLTEELEAAYAAVESDDGAKYQILVTHGAWRESDDRLIGSVGEFNEQFLENPEKKTGLTFDYIALGHYHKHLPVTDHAVYSGSTERTSFNEIGYTSGYVVVDLEQKSWQYHEIESRPMLRLGPIDCSGLAATEIYDRLQEMSPRVPKGALVRLELDVLSRETLLSLDGQEIDRLFQQALYVEKILNPALESGLQHTSASIGSLPVEFERYVQELDEFGLDKERFLQIGQRLLQSAEDEEQQMESSGDL